MKPPNASKNISIGDLVTILRLIPLYIAQVSIHIHTFSLDLRKSGPAISVPTISKTAASRTLYLDKGTRHQVFQYYTADIF